MLGRGLVVVQWASNVVKSKAGLSTNQERNVILGLCCVVGSCYTSGGGGIGKSPLRSDKCC